MNERILGEENEEEEEEKNRTEEKERTEEMRIGNDCLGRGRRGGKIGME